MTMRINKIITVASILFLVVSACSNTKKNTSDKLAFLNQEIDSTARYLLEKFSLTYLKPFVLDENSLIFYCIRNSDTSSLIHLRKNGSELRGIFYEILPSYHQFVNDFVKEKNKLIFFEGYSFTIDSAIWEAVGREAQQIIQIKGSTENIDLLHESNYGLIYDSQINQSNSNNKYLYERFDKFLKDSFLREIIELRKPRMYKIE